MLVVSQGLALYVVAQTIVAHEDAIESYDCLEYAPQYNLT